MKVAIVSRAHIDFGERRREDYGDLEELAKSIQDRGIIQPLAVLSTPSAELPYRLLAGGRRFRAIEMASINEVPVRIYDEELPELEIRAIELAENIYRKDLEWHEEVKLQKEIHTLQTEIHGAVRPGARTDLGLGMMGWSMKDTAELVGRSKSSVQKDVRIAEMLEKHPDVFSKCKTKLEATKVLDQMREEVIRQEMAKRAQERMSETSHGKLAERFILKDFFQGVKDIPDGSIHLVELDPPYGMDLHTLKARKDQTDLALHDYNEVSADDYLAFMDRVFKECFRVMAPHSWIICWFAHEPWFEPMFQLMIQNGFKGSRMVGMWKKPNGQTKQPDIYLANCTEFFFYMRKGSPVMATPGRTNVFEHAPVPAQKKVHPTERPLDLIKDILSTFTSPNMRVLVPFLGSGKTLIAAQALGMDPIGFELTKQYKDSFLVNLTKGVIL